MLFAVSFTLSDSKINAIQLAEELMKSTGWMHYIDDTWIIATQETVQQLYDRLKPLFQEKDSFIIIEIKKDSLYYGLLPQKGWDWLKETIEKGWARP